MAGPATAVSVGGGLGTGAGADILCCEPRRTRIMAPGVRDGLERAVLGSGY